MFHAVDFTRHDDALALRRQVVNICVQVARYRALVVIVASVRVCFAWPGKFIVVDCLARLDDNAASPHALRFDVILA